MIVDLVLPRINDTFVQAKFYKCIPEEQIYSLFPAEETHISRAKSLVDDLGRILEKDIMIRGSATNALLGVELCTIDKREIFTSVDKYVEYAQRIRKRPFFRSLEKTKQ